MKTVSRILAVVLAFTLLAAIPTVSAAETNTNTKTEVENESPHRDWLGYAIAFVLGALTASAIFAVVLLIKRKGTK